MYIKESFHSSKKQLYFLKNHREMNASLSLHILLLFKPPFLLTLLLCFFTNESNSTVSADQISLLAFKSEIKHDPFRVFNSWNESTPFCRWRGVVCGRLHPERVTAINLNSFSLSGSISPSITNLTFLQSISLASNRLTGQIPREIGNLHRLEFLNMSLNSISGAIPTTFGNISSLKVIDLRSNRLTGEIPPTLTYLSVLQVLNLRSNMIGGNIPSNLTNCRDLRVLSLRSNFFVGKIPLEFGYLTKLTQLTLGYNNLTGPIPSSLGELSNLEYLDLPYNYLTGSIPRSLGNLTSLIWLDLSFNNIYGSIPSSLGNLATILTLQLTKNRLEGTIPSSFGNLSFVQGLGLASNSLHGEIPQSLGKLSSLIDLDCSGNLLSGQIPTIIGQLSSLELLNLGYNNLTGKIPDSIYNLTNLATLILGSNLLEGTLRADMGDKFPYLEMLRIFSTPIEGPIPASLSNASLLGDIELMGNSFSGSIPSIFGNMLNLYYLDISYNNLEARNPEDWDFMVSLVNCTGLQNFDIGYNLLGGMMPDSLVNLSRSLNYLALGNNLIQGSIPSGIGNLVNLTYLDMSNNLLVGVIPVGIGNLLILQTLDLSENSISGEIPSSIKNLTKMNRLYLSSNNLEGTIPESFGNMLNLELMNLSNNKLIGSIPKEVARRSSLSNFLDLSYNQFNGTVPSEIGSLKNLQELRLSSNRLSGVIPKALGECEILESLYLEMNSFEGIIPSSFSNLRGLQELDLSNNILSGQIPSFLEELPYLNYLNFSFNNFEGEVPKNGVFSNSSEISLRGNTELCGGISELHLPKCVSSATKKKGISNDIRIILVTIGGILVLLILLFIFLACYYSKKRKTKQLSALSFKHEYSLVSYDELFRTTNGFSPMNLIGGGTFGSVYKGVMNLDIKRNEVAVKVFNLDQYGALKSFFSECEALRTIRHRNLVKILTSCSSIDHSGEEFKALVFEYMPNGSLDEWLHHDPSNDYPFKRLSLKQRLNIAIDIASALEYLHNGQGDSPIVHCDLKPSNVLLDDDLVAHVGDFGLAKFLIEDHDESLRTSTSTATFKGSIGYVPPEYGMSGKVSIFGDIYSYGILLLEMVTGKRPTGEGFIEGQNLHAYVQAAFPEQTMDIIDINMVILTDECASTSGDNKNGKCMSENTVKCLVLLIECGLSCSNESPKERPEIQIVLKNLFRAREMLA
ncbi:hypothetical protein LUZ60_012366 [Juncus effusus]|nr:hypothetical protein LUZ60_012366 [Juncus effusus]